MEIIFRDLIALLNEHEVEGYEATTKKFSHLLASVVALKNQYETLLHSKEIYKAYVDAYECTEEGRKIALGYQAMKIYCQHNVANPINTTTC